ncbi:hypothetical protein D3C86_1441900 [compost metagenome]
MQFLIGRAHGHGFVFLSGIAVVVYLIASFSGSAEAAHVKCRIREYFLEGLAGSKVIQYDFGRVALQVAQYIRIMRIRCRIVEGNDRKLIFPCSRGNLFKRLVLGSSVIDFVLGTVVLFGITFQHAVLVKIITSNRIGGIFIFEQFDQRPSLDVKLERFEDFRIVFVHLDNHIIRLLFQYLDDAGTNAFKRSKVHLVAAVKVYAIDVEVFIAAFVLHIDQALVVRPAVAADQLVFFFDGLDNLAGSGVLDIDMVLALVVAFLIRKIKSVWRKLEAALCRSLEIIVYRIAVGACF